MISAVLANLDAGESHLAIHQLRQRLGRPRDADLAEQRAQALFPTYWKLLSSKGRS